jgi:autotransporter-associated beta strand protein
VGADRFWDTNSDTAGGSNSDTAPGTWGVDNFWSTAADGLAVTGPWVVDDTAVFSADTNVTGTYDVTLSGTQSAGGVRFEDGTVTITGGTELTLTAPTVDVASGLTATINSVLGGAAAIGTPGLTKAGAGTLVLGGATTNTYAQSTRVAANGGRLQLGASNVIPDSSIVEIGGAGAIFDLNGQTETVKSITNVGGGPFMGSRIEVGTGTLIIDDTGLTPQTYQLSYTASGTGKIIKNGDGQLTLTGNSLAFDGEFILNSGAVSIGEIRNFGDSSSATAKLTINGGTLKLAGTTLSVRVPKVDIAGDFTYDHTANANQLQFIGSAGSVVFTLQDSNPVITTNTTGTGTMIFAGKVVDGPGDTPADKRGFTKDGPGTMTLQAKANSYRGDTTIKAGTLTLGFNSAIVSLVGSPGNLGGPDIDGNYGTLRLQGGTLLIARFRSLLAADNEFINNPVELTADSAITTNNNVAGTPIVNVNFTSNTLGGSGGTLTLRDDAAAGGGHPTGTAHRFDVRFSGSGFNFPRPIVLAPGANAERIARLVSANTTGTQTYSGVISGPGAFYRTIGPEDTPGSGGTTVFTEANTYAGGTLIDNGTLTVSGSSATLGTGNVTVTGGHLAISTGVANAILDTATLTLLGGGTAMMADTGFLDLGTGISERVGSLFLGTDLNPKPNGTYGSTLSAATFQDNEFFAGMGILTVGPAGVLGDFNSDGKVDAADYVIWRENENGFTALPNDNNLGTPIGQAHYNLWRSNFGNPPASASSLAVAVPEPASLWLVAVVAGWTVAGCRRLRTA